MINSSPCSTFSASHLGILALPYRLHRWSSSLDIYLSVNKVIAEWARVVASPRFPVCVRGLLLKYRKQDSLSTTGASRTLRTSTPKICGYLSLTCAETLRVLHPNLEAGHIHNGFK